MLKLFRVFCNDGGYCDMQDALSIAKELNNDILLAHVYRNANFLTEYSLNEQIQLMDHAYKIFNDNGMTDHAISCKNNMIVRQFYTNDIIIQNFIDLQEEANNKVPGLVGLSHIHNNTGASLLTKGYYEEAIDAFDKALNYTFRPERCVQNAAILSNRLVAKSCCYYRIEERELFRTLERIISNDELLKLDEIELQNNSSNETIEEYVNALEKYKLIGGYTCIIPLKSILFSGGKSSLPSTCALV